VPSNFWLSWANIVGTTKKAGIPSGFINPAKLLIMGPSPQGKEKPEYRWIDQVSVEPKFSDLTIQKLAPLWYLAESKKDFSACSTDSSQPIG